LASQLVYAAKASDVRHVMVHGRQVVRDRRVLTLAAGEILSKAREWGERIQSSLQQKQRERQAAQQDPQCLRLAPIAGE
jgi:5-methylthioadenosine/S-adenosylhomocysteine deaminase